MTLNRQRLLLPLVLLSLISASCRTTPDGIVAKAQDHAENAVPAGPTPYFEISMKSQGKRVPVLMYHDVIAARNRDSQWFDCTAEEFAEQLLKIQEEGATPISLDQLHAHLTQGQPIPEKSVVLTFDDNYQGFYDHALPLLRRYNYPAAVFVHTGFVGNKEGMHPKMDWPTLKELSQDSLVTIGSHTITHPDDLSQLDEAAQVKEMAESKALLEEQLGKSIPYLAYPNGKNDAVTQKLARDIGYTMAFSIDNGLAEESPSILCVNRYVHTRIDKAFEDWERSTEGGAHGPFLAALNDAPVTYHEARYERVKLGLIIGGKPRSLMSETREAVSDFIQRTPTAVAGINGGFFAMSALAGTDNKMVGPLKTRDMPDVLPDVARERWAKLRNRPVIMWGPTSFGIVPYQPEVMATSEAYHEFMPDMTDTFLTGVWLVHGGVARTKEQMNTFGASDIQDPRKRAFIGITADGLMVLGASLQGCTSARLAEAAAAAGVYEAVLLDSGFSTSLVYGQSVKAFGHSTPTKPSRPVPHAVLLEGVLDPATEALAMKQE